MTMITAISAVLLATSPIAVSSATLTQDSDLGVQALGQGRNAEAIAELETKPAPDSAQLINLGIAYAREGDVDKARTLFRAALAEDNPMEVETADGQLTNSRRLARKALRMLDRGEFAAVSTQRNASRVTLRQ
ncbi:MAG: tetratricopeptide repeat protein [Pseudomonadota bacterium]